MLLYLTCASLGLDCPLCDEGQLCLLEKRLIQKKKKKKKKNSVMGMICKIILLPFTEMLVNLSANSTSCFLVE
jgi:hypothetical protein